MDGSLNIRKSESDGRTYINPEVNADNVRFLDFAKDNQKGNDSQKRKTKGENSKLEDLDVPF